MRVNELSIISKTIADLISEYNDNVDDCDKLQVFIIPNRDDGFWITKIIRGLLKNYESYS